MLVKWHKYRAGANRTRNGLWKYVGIIALVLGMGGGQASGSVTRSISNWQTATVGIFSEESNWDGGVPGDGNDAGSNTPYFNLGATYTVDFIADTATYEADVEGGNVTLDLEMHAYTVNTDTGSRFFVGRDVNHSAVLTVKNGALNTYSATIANQNNTTADVTLSNATWSVANTLIVGNNGSGTFALDSDASGSSVSFTLGGSATGSGAASIYGSWSNTKDLIAGQSGQGTLRILDDGSITSKNIYVSNTTDAAGGSIVTSGISAKLTATGEIAVGGKHEATAEASLSVGDSAGRSGGQVTSPTLTIWNTGTLNLTGNGTIISNTVNLDGAKLNLSGVNNAIDGDIVLSPAVATLVTLDAGSDAATILNVTGDLTVAGTLHVALGDTQPADGSSFNLFDWAGQAVGSMPASSPLSFSDVILDDPGHGWTWDQSKLSSEGIISITVPEPGMATLLGIGVMGLLLRRRRRVCFSTSSGAHGALNWILYEGLKLDT